MSVADQLARLICLGSEDDNWIAPADDRSAQLVRRGVFEGAAENPPHLNPLPQGGEEMPAKGLICAWCDKENGIVRLLASGASHGMCPRHERMFAAELDKLRPKGGHHV